MNDKKKSKISFLVPKKRKGGLSIIFGETIVQKQEWVDILPSDRPKSTARNKVLMRASNCQALTRGFLERVIASRIGRRAPDMEVTYSVSTPKKRELKRLEIPSDLINTLAEKTKLKPKKRNPSPRRSRASLPHTPSGLKFELAPVLEPVKAKKKVRFADEVTIHHVSIHNYSPAPKPETFKLIITLQCVWQALDVDEDSYLNLVEFSHFANEVWENEDCEGMLKAYAKDPKKGMDFDEWCSLLKEEDPGLHGLVDELYEMFVDEGSYDSEETGDEKKME